MNTNRIAQACERYTKASCAFAHLETFKTPTARYLEARRMLQVASRPCGRFGLEAEDCAEVAAALQNEVADLNSNFRIEKRAALVRDLRSALVVDTIRQACAIVDADGSAGIVELFDLST